MPEKKESWDIKCTEEGCQGEVDFDNYTTVQTGCHSCSTVYACNTCGRLHFKNDESMNVTGVTSRQDKKAFLVAHGEIDLRD